MNPFDPSIRQRWLLPRLAIQNLGRRPLRAALLALAVAVSSGVVFAALVVSRGLNAGLDSGFSRLGADLMVVPRDTLVNLTSALLTVEPTPHTLDAQLADEIARLPGVEKVAPQRVFRTPAESTSCRHEVDLIAFDPARDFTVLPWLRDRLDRPMQAGDVLIGGRRDYRLGEQLTFYGQPLTVHGRLGRTGVGPFDHAFFITFDTAATMGQASAAFPHDPTRVSALLIQLDATAAPEEVRFAIAQKPEVKVVAGGTLLSSTRQGLAALFGGLTALALLMLLGTVLLVGVLFSAVLAERRRELGLLRAVGARRGQVVRLVLVESMLATGLGGLAGIVLGGVLLRVFRSSLIHYLEGLHVPFAWPDLGVTLLLGAGCVLLAAGVGLVGAGLPAWRVSRRELYDLLRSEG
jgi:putative ABC transport system permease protein